MDTAALIVGIVIIALVVVQLVLVLFSSIQNVARQRDQQELSRLLLLERIEAARAARQQQGPATAWNGYRKFVVDRKELEADNIYSFYLVPHDGKPLPGFKPGQFLTFQVNLPNQKKPVVRCYSLSDAPRPDYYRVTIKRVGPSTEAPAAPDGLISTYFHDHVHEGDILDVKAPGGHFVIDPALRRPAVLIAGGIGITPLLCMINTIIEIGSHREMWLFYGVRGGLDHAMKEHLKKCIGIHDNLRVVTCYSQPSNEDVAEQDYDHAGHIALELLKQYLNTSNYEFFICGPPPMMKDVTAQLKRWGVPKDDIHTEAFGPATVKAKKAAEPAEPRKTAATIKITFAKSGKSLAWRDDTANLLEFAEAHNVEIPFGCRSGGCGTCVVAIKSGDVKYDDEPEFATHKGCCLTCVGRPATDVVLDA